MKDSNMKDSKSNKKGSNLILHLKKAYMRKWDRRSEGEVIGAWRRGPTCRPVTKPISETSVFNTY